MPMLAAAIVSPWASWKGRLNAFSTRSATATASSSSNRSSHRITNSSPPNRASVSCRRSEWPTRSATATSSSSPSPWPRLSLITLKRSRSRNSTATERVGPRPSRSSASFRLLRYSRRLGRPVSGSRSNWFSFVRQATTCATLAASTNPPWMHAHSHGFLSACGLSPNTAFGSSTPPTPWWTTTNAIATRNGVQSWYRVRTPIITKKWKCASVMPPHRSTSTAEQVTRPNDAAMIRAFSRNRSRARADAAQCDHAHVDARVQDRVAHQDAEREQRRHVEPEQDDDRAVAPAQHVLGQQLPLGQPVLQVEPLAAEPRAERRATARRGRGRSDRRPHRRRRGPRPGRPPGALGHRAHQAADCFA